MKYVIVQYILSSSFIFFMFSSWTYLTFTYKDPYWAHGGDWPYNLISIPYVIYGSSLDLLLLSVTILLLFCQTLFISFDTSCCYWRGLHPFNVSYLLIVGQTSIFFSCVYLLIFLSLIKLLSLQPILSHWLVVTILFHNDLLSHFYLILQCSVLFLFYPSSHGLYALVPHI